MTMTDTTPGPQSGTRTVTAFFDTAEAAAHAKADLIASGLPAESITAIGSDAGHFTVEEDRSHGLWETLKDFFMPDDDRRAYHEGLRRGGHALSVRTSEALYDKAIDVLDRDGAIDLDERELAWEKEGWTRSAGGVDNIPATDYAYKPADASTAGFGGSYAGEDGIAHVDEATNPDVRERIGAGTAKQSVSAPTGGPQTYADPATPATDAAADQASGRDAASGDIVGRRDIEHGRTRVRSYIVEGDVNR